MEFNGICWIDWILKDSLDYLGLISIERIDGFESSWLVDWLEEILIHCVRGFELSGLDSSSLNGYPGLLGMIWIEVIG